MHITDIRHITVPIATDMANAFISFSKSRYPQPGVLSHRIIPRVLEAESAALIDPALPDAVGIGLELKSPLRPMLEQLGS
jgi:hypothetical protein